MSYAFDTIAKAWARLRASLPPEERDGELAARFEFALEELHEANHRLKDAVNKDERVRRHAVRLDEVMDREQQSKSVQKRLAHRHFSPRSSEIHERANAGEQVSDYCANCGNEFMDHHNGVCP